MSEEKGRYDLEKIKRENAVLRKYAAMQAAAEETVGCQTIYVDIAGGLEEGFVLDELIFFTLPRPETGRSGLRVWKEGVLWMAVSRTEWWERKRLTERQADGAIARLVKKNLVFKERFLFNKQLTTHLRLNVPEFFKRYTEVLEERNPPEDESDTMLKDIQDLYEMLGIPNGDTPEIPEETPPQEGQGIPNGDKVSLKGDSLNIPHTPSTQPVLIGAGAPLDWKLGHGEEITEEDLRAETDRKMIDSANLIASGTGAKSPLYYNIAYAFMVARQIVLPGIKAKGQRKAAKEMIESGVAPKHVVEAVKKLTDANMTVTDLFSVSKTAISLANPAPTEGYNPQGLQVGI